MSGGIYVHIPFCKARCRYCSFTSGADLSWQNVYVDALEREIAARKGFVADTIYIGGGTPSTLYRGALSRIIEALRKYDRIADGAEITVEANPESADRAFFEECHAIGVNRISLGLQTTDDALLKKLGRIHTFDRFVEAYDLARAFVMRTSVDLMLGIPDQTEADAVRSVEEVLRLGAEHISVYALGVEEGTPLYADGYRPDEDEQARMYDACYRLLTGAGLERYEVSNFAVTGQESRHNLKYWTMQPYLGLGAAAHSFDGKTRRANTDNVAAYMASGAFEETTESDEELREEYVMLSLRTADGLSLSRYARQFGRDLLEEKREVIDRLCADGFLLLKDDRLRLAENAFYVMNGVIVDLL